MWVRKGQIVTSSQDTLTGFIKDCGISRNSNECLFKETKSSKVVKYNASELKSYHLFDYKKYVSKYIFTKQEFKNQFIEVLLESNINLYYFHKNKDVTYYAEKQNNKLIGLVNERFVSTRSKGSYNSDHTWQEIEIENPIYIDTLFSMMKDKENIVSQLYGLEYKVKPLVNLLKEYSLQTCKNGDCISYQKDLNVSKDRFGIYSGIEFSKINFTESETESAINYSIPIGILYNIPLSTINERFSIQFELVYNNYKYNSGFINLPDGVIDIKMTSNEISIPFSFQYKLNVNRLAPVIGLGKEMGFIVTSDVPFTNQADDYVYDNNLFIYKFQKGSWFFDLGVEYEQKSNFLIFSKLRFHRHYNKIIEDKNINNFTYKKAEGIEFVTNSLSLVCGVKF